MMSNERPLRNALDFEAPTEPPSSLSADASIAIAAIARIDSALKQDAAMLPSALLRRQLNAIGASVAEARSELAADIEYGARTLDMTALLSSLAEAVDAARDVLDRHHGALLPLRRPAEPIPTVSETPDAVSSTFYAPDTQVPTVSGIVAGREGETVSKPSPTDRSQAPVQAAPSVEELAQLIEALSRKFAQPADAAMEQPDTDLQAWQAELTDSVSDAAVPPMPELLRNLQQMRAAPVFASPDRGAVIFQPSPDQAGMAVGGSASHVRPAPSSPARPQTPETDAAALLFASSNDSDPTEFVLEHPIPRTAAVTSTAASVPPEPEAPRRPASDPFAPVRAMSEVERIALFG